MGWKVLDLHGGLCCGEGRCTLRLHQPQQVHTFTSPANDCSRKNPGWSSSGTGPQGAAQSHSLSSGHVAQGWPCGVHGKWPAQSFPADPHGGCSLLFLPREFPVCIEATRVHVRRQGSPEGWDPPGTPPSSYFWLEGKKREEAGEVRGHGPGHEPRGMEQLSSSGLFLSFTEAATWELLSFPAPPPHPTPRHNL